MTRESRILSISSPLSENRLRQYPIIMSYFISRPSPGSRRGNAEEKEVQKKKLIPTKVAQRKEFDCTFEAFDSRHLEKKYSKNILEENKK